VDGQEDNPSLTARLPDLPHSIDAVEYRHGDVDHKNVRSSRFMAGVMYFRPRKASRMVLVSSEAAEVFSR